MKSNYHFIKKITFGGTLKSNPINLDFKQLPIFSDLKIKKNDLASNKILFTLVSKVLEEDDYAKNMLTFKETISYLDWNKSIAEM